jgi:hypothetical protein
LKTFADFKSEFPQMFDNCHGFSFGEGWLDLVHKLTSDLQKLDPALKVLQVKEKFGGLRFYVGPASKLVHDRIELAEKESYQTCEVCGSKEAKVRTGGWLRTLCDAHEKGDA